ncbi:MAG: hypothetical protein V1788_00435 [Nanoarchaeota archaeon]|nr:hypothetical protein [Nanoarchaeota archaeon]
MAQVVELPSEGELKDMYAKPINPTEKYDNKIFVPTHNRDSKLEQKVDGLKKDIHSPKYIKDISKILYNGKADAYAKFPNQGEVARFDADRFIDNAEKSKALHVKNNLDDFFKLVDGNQMLNLVRSLPLYKTNDEKHNKLVDAINEMRDIQDASKDFSKMSQYVESKLEGIPAWLQESLSYYSENQEYISSVFKQFAGFAQNRFQKETHLFLVENGKIKKAVANRGKLEKALRDSLDKLWEMYKDETISGEKSDIIDDRINPYYLALANTVYPKEDNKFKKDQDEDAAIRDENRNQAHLVPYPIKKAA